MTFAHLAFDVPGDWSHYDTNHRGVSTEVWSPSGNDEKESLTVIRTELAPVTAQGDASTLSTLLAQAQAGLPESRVSARSSVSTKMGFSGARVDLDYLPNGLKDRYHRIHVVLVDGKSLVHVLYTAKTPDANLNAFNLLLASIHEGEG
ncbi:MAG TPA: hypothetical protein VGF94_17055 [Kofleriaceae bacterium]